MAENEQNQTESSWESFKKEGLTMLKTLGNLIDQAADDLSKLTVVSLEMDDRKKIDSLVNAGVVNNRGAALRYLVSAGIRSKKEVFEKISQTDQEIQHIKENLGKTFASQQME